MMLFGDIGGTKTQLATAESFAAPLSSVTTYQNTDFESIEQLLAQFLSERSGTVRQAGFCVAGPLKNNVCEMTNLDWRVSADALAERFAFQQVILINDLTATACAIPVLSASDFISIQNGTVTSAVGNIAVLSIGTGLGESVLIGQSSGTFLALASEGGHKAFAAQTALEVELAEYLRRIQQQRYLEVEQLARGQGIMRIVEFLRTVYPQWLCEGDETLRQPDQVVAQARQNPASIAHRALELFAGIIAGEAANVALQYWSTGGVMIAGGVPLRMTEFFNNDAFRQRFSEHPVYADWLQTLPVAVCSSYQAPLLGVKYFAERSGFG